MEKQALVLGLGQFGMSTARALGERGVEVVVVDTDSRLVQQASSWATEALIFDATDEEALSRTSPGDRDICVVAIGNESRDGSIVATALLRQMGAKHIVARANDTIHERILRLVGAHETVNPEQAFGVRLAARLAHSGVLDQVELGDELVLAELEVPKRLVGRTLRDAEFRSKYGVSVVAIRTQSAGRAQVVLPDPSLPLKEADILVVAATKDEVGGLAERFA